MSEQLAAVQALLQAWFDEGDSAALDAACTMARQQPLEVSTLMTWLQREALAEDAARDLALRRIRRALGLPMMPGPVCRPQPK